MNIQWYTAMYASPTSAKIADVSGSRLYVKRTGKGHRTFAGYINGVQVGVWDTLQMAMSQTAKIFKFEDEE